MGLFSKKDKAEKSRPDLLNPTTTAPPPTSNTTNTANTANNSSIANTPSTANQAPQHSHQNSYHDSAFYSTNGSNLSDERVPVIQKNQQTQLQNQIPGTTITTTTTTTTVTTTVTSDGRTQTSTHPYNPVTDPPVRSQETSVHEDTSRTNTIGGSISTNSSNPNSSTTIPQTQTTSKLNPTAQRPEVQRTVTPGRKPTPQEMMSDSHFNIIPPTPQGSIDVPTSPTTTGGRIIPPRSERRTSPNGGRSYAEPTVEFGPESPGPPLRSQKRNSIDRGLNVAPLKTSHSPSNSNAGSRPVSSQGVIGSEQPRRSYEAPAPIVPPKDNGETYFPGDRSGQSLRDSYQNQNQSHGGYDPSTYQQNQHHVANSSEPMASGGIGPDSRSHTPNYSRPGPTVTSPTTFDAPPTSASAMHPPAVEKPSHRQSLTSAFKGIQGASEVLRGSINSGIAKTTHDKAEQERMRAIREQGMKDYKASGLGDKMWGGRVGERGDGTRRLRKRSLSRSGVHGTEGPGGLEAVEERSIGDSRS